MILAPKPGQQPFKDELIMNNLRGLSLLELSIALAVVALLGVVIVGGSSALLANADIQQRRDSLKAIAQECLYYRAKFNKWPVFVHDLINEDLISMQYFNALSQRGMELSFKRKGEILLISDGQGLEEAAMPSQGLARLAYARNSETGKFKKTSVLAY